MEYAEEVVAHYNRGCDLLKNKRIEDAQKEFEEAIRLSPMCVEALINLGNCLRYTGKEADSVCYYVRAIDAEPDNALAHFNYGLALYGIDRFKEAVTELDHAIRTEPNDHTTHYMLARYSATAGMSLKALKHAQIAIQLRPLDAACYHALLDTTMLILCNTIIGMRGRRT